MPFGDETGPRRRGRFTGRGLGYCAGYRSPGYTKVSPRRQRPRQRFIRAPRRRYSLGSRELGFRRNWRRTLERELTEEEKKDMLEKDKEEIERTIKGMKKEIEKIEEEKEKLE